MSMRVFQGFDNLPAFRHPAVTVGSYDGVHGGHAELLAAVRRLAHAHDGESIVVTFSPHPRLVLETPATLRLLTTPEEKACLLERAGIDNLIIVPFTREFSRTDSREFVRRDLIGRLGVETLVMGYNHRFGHNKEGDCHRLHTLYEDAGIEVLEVGRCDIGGEKVSSTVIRQLIEQGEMAHAARMLRHPYLIIADIDTGEVKITDPHKLLPPAGRYTVSIDGATAWLTVGEQGALHLAPTVSKKQAHIEFTEIC